MKGGIVKSKFMHQHLISPFEHIISNLQISIMNFNQCSYSEENSVMQGPMNLCSEREGMMTLLFKIK